MAVIRPRNRILYFRVSEDEFAQFNQICESKGARSISELARFAVQNMIEEGGNGKSGSLSERLVVLETMVRDLNGIIQQLAVSLGRENCGRAGCLPEDIGKVETES